MKKDDRFEKIYSQGTLNGMEIWRDRVTGVQYLYCFSGYAGGLTALLDADGRPGISPEIRVNRRKSLDKCGRIAYNSLVESRFYLTVPA